MELQDLERYSFFKPINPANGALSDRTYRLLNIFSDSYKIKEMASRVIEYFPRPRFDKGKVIDLGKCLKKYRKEQNGQE